MGRANYILLAFGVAAIVVMSMLMQHLLRVQKDGKQSPVAREVLSAFGGRMAGEPQMRIESGKDGVTATLTLRTLLGVDANRLARETGEYVWRRLGESERLGSVLVKTVDEVDGGVTTHQIPPPLFARGLASRPHSTAAAASSRPGSAAGSRLAEPPR